MNVIKDKTILIAGGAGSIGGALVRELVKYEPKAIRILDIHEFSHYQLEKTIPREFKGKVTFLLGDIRDKDRVIRAAEDVDIIYNAAAYKHVPLCEYNPFEAIKVNVIGNQNLIDAAFHHNVEKFIFISSDKAANPAGTLGASKLLGEKITTAANFYRGKTKCVFASVRFGNVTMSSGSVIPLFVDQIQNKNPITITSPNMTRFLMSMNRAVELIVRATEEMRGGEVFVLKMKSVNIEKLAQALATAYTSATGGATKPQFHYIGHRPGEKMHEELITEEESRRMEETKDMLIIMPLDPPYQKRRVNRGGTKKFDHRLYSSQKPLMTRAELQALIKENGFFQHEHQKI